LKSTRTILLISLCLLVSGFEANGQQDSSPRLLVDYVQSVLYRGERLSTSVKAFLPQPVSELPVLRAKVRHKEVLVLTEDYSFVLLPNGTWHLDLTLQLPDVRSDEALCTLSLMYDGVEGDRVTILIAAPNSKMPVFQVEEDRLITEDGRTLVLQIDKRPWIEDRSWPVIKFFRKRAEQTKHQPEEVLLIADLPGPSAENKDYWTLLRRRLLNQEVRLVGSAKGYNVHENPALTALAKFSSVDFNNSINAAVIFLGTADQKWGTGPRTFGLILEAMLQRLEIAGCMEVCIVLPIAPLPLGAGMQPYVEAALKVKRIYKTKVINLPRRLGESCWLSGGMQGVSVYLESPNEKGQRKIADTLFQALSEYTNLK